MDSLADECDVWDDVVDESDGDFDEDVAVDVGFIETLKHERIRPNTNGFVR